MSIRKFTYTVRISEEALRSEDSANNDGHVVATPKTEKWLSARADFLEKWTQLEREGIQAGFLDTEPCYECGGQVIPTTHLEDRKWVPA